MPQGFLYTTLTSRYGKEFSRFISQVLYSTLPSAEYSHGRKLPPAKDPDGRKLPPAKDPDGGKLFPVEVVDQ